MCHGWYAEIPIGELKCDFAEVIPNSPQICGIPIIAVQVENEYGSFGHDKVYLAHIRDALKSAGFTDALLYTSDGPEELPDGTLPDLPAVVNFGPGYAEKGLGILEKFRPGAPLMIGEYWDGWFDQWGRPHSSTQGKEESEVKEIEWVLQHGYSINFYMFHGGTSWGFMNGATSDGPHDYWADTSSYDFSATLDESGRPTKKYFMFRDLIAKHAGEKLPDVPHMPDPMAIPEFRLEQVAPLFTNLPKAIESEKPRSMESVGHSYGYILYRTQITGPVSGNLDVNDVRDYAQVYVDGKLVGTLDRRLDENRLPLRLPQGKVQLDILAENSGRVNFAWKPQSSPSALSTERKGITKSVLLNGKELTGWQIFTFPMTELSELKFGGDVSGPAFCRGTFDVPQIRDTYLDLGGWSKGTVWVNGHQLGRFWDIGPQQTLYVPGPWLKKKGNEVVVLDLKPQSDPVLRGLDHQVLDDLRHPTRRLRNSRERRTKERLMHSRLRSAIGLAHTNFETWPSSSHVFVTHLRLAVALDGNDCSGLVGGRYRKTSDAQ